MGVGPSLQPTAVPISVERLIELREKAIDKETKEFLEKLISKSVKRS